MKTTRRFDVSKTGILLIILITVTAGYFLVTSGNHLIKKAFDDTHAVAVWSPVTYTVAPGDNLWLIAEKYNTSASEIITLNNLTSTVIYVGQVLKIPQESNTLNIRLIDYRVRFGDTLGTIAEYFGTNVLTIKSINALPNYEISTGQILKIPAEYINYKVVWGDTLFNIASKFKTSAKRVMLFNNMTNTMLIVGEILHIPYIAEPPSSNNITHIVEAGENPWTISLKYGITQKELLAVNGLTESSSLSIGQKLLVPVYSIPVRLTPGPQFGEYQDWWSGAQYLFPIGTKAQVIDFVTGRSFNIKRTIGASHADCEPLTSYDSGIIKDLWDGVYSWRTRSVIVVINNRKIAASMSSAPHGIEYIGDNAFNGHFDIHFKNSRRHKDDAIDEAHQAKIRISAGADFNR